MRAYNPAGVFDLTCQLELESCPNMRKDVAVRLKRKDVIPRYTRVELFAGVDQDESGADEPRQMCLRKGMPGSFRTRSHPFARRPG